MRGQGEAGHGLARYVPAVEWLGGYQGRGCAATWSPA
jgi:hypothetical protein